MRRLIFLITMCCIYISLCAQEYQMSEIETIAYSFFNASPQYSPGIDGNHSTKQISSIEAILRDSINYMYIVNAEQSSGWVILSNEKRYSSIIAYSDSGNFTYEADFLSPALVCILENHMNMIDSVRCGRIQPKNITYSNQNSTLLYQTNNLLGDVKWDQSGNKNGSLADCDKIYNKFCPEVKRDTCTDWLEETHPKMRTCNRKLAGCGAIAMAQLMRYWQWPDCAKIDNEWRYYDWDNMPNFIDNSTDMYTVNTVASFISDCRIAAKSFGACTWTAAEISKIHDAMKEVFGYNSNLVRETENIDIPSMLMNEIEHNRPVIVQAWGDDLGMGHTFIVDGYKLHTNEVLYHTHFGNGGDKSYVNLSFAGYHKWQTYLIELYPLCNLRADDISLGNTNSMVILPGNHRTYYSTNNVTVCSNNKFVNVNTNGHLLIKAGNEVRINNGFHAQAGSDVHIMIESLCHTPTSTFSSAPQRITSRVSSLGDIGSTSEEVANSNLEDLACEMIVCTSIYSASGQLLQTITGGQRDASHLPSGMYILQYRMSDGTVKSEKVTNNK